MAVGGSRRRQISVAVSVVSGGRGMPMPVAGKFLEAWMVVANGPRAGQFVAPQAMTQAINFLDLATGFADTYAGNRRPPLGSGPQGLGGPRQGPGRGWRYGMKGWGPVVRVKGLEHGVGV